ncbi:MAG: DUF1343 domain-containing protein [Phycisphaerales bacterium]|nr:DUF1343 domain-containing protein [Phycisphaerales bacterium]
MTKILFLFLLIGIASNALAQLSKQADIQVGASRLDEYLPQLKGKKVALLINQTSVVNEILLLDTLLDLGVNVTKVFVPEHGFRGTADAGAHVKNEIDGESGLPIISLYGNNKKPSKEQMQNVDVLLYDLQDVGVRFYTYISTLEYAMDACIENQTMLLVLDRPNPNGHLVDGPVLDTALKSFVGMQAIPIVYGMTVGEYAQMLVGELWVKNATKLQMKIIPCRNYTHKRRYSLPIAPSPNLKTMAAIYLYPSLCFFEGTVVSLGRGTDKPFQQWGHPDYTAKSSYYFTPKSALGASKPLLENQACYGQLVTDNADTAYAIGANKINLEYLLKAYQWSTEKDKFFNPFFEKLAGTKLLRLQIQKGLNEAQIRDTWQAPLAQFKKIRKKYLLYED